MNILINFLLGLLVLLCFVLVVVILMQRPKNEGLGAAFGGGMTENIFGARTTDVLQRFTSYLAGGFFLLTILLAFLFAKQSVGGTAAQKMLLNAPPPKSPATAPAVATPPAPATNAPAVATPDATASPTPANQAAPSPTTPAETAPAATPAPSPAPSPEAN